MSKDLKLSYPRGSLYDSEEVPLLDKALKESSDNKKFLCCCSLYVIFIILLGVASLLLFLLKHELTEGIFVHEGDTIMLDDDNGLSYSEWEVVLCPVSEVLASIYLVQEESIILHKKEQVVSNQSYQQYPARDTGHLPTPHYLWTGSCIKYSICISSIETRPKEGTFYLFDNYDTYDNFLNYKQDGTGALYQQSIAIGSDNKTECSRLDIVVNGTSYYFPTVETPHEITYRFNATIEQLYVDNTDYLEYCRIRGDDNCTLSLPHSSTEYFLLAYVHPLSSFDLEPSMVNLCVRLKKPFLLPLILGCVAIGITLLSVVVSAVYVFNVCCTRKSISVNSDIQ